MLGFKIGKSTWKKVYTRGFNVTESNRWSLVQATTAEGKAKKNKSLRV